jgi:type IV secretion system protein TrbL
MKSMHKAALTGACLLLYSAGAAAQLTSSGMLDQVVTEFATRASSWQIVIMSAATWLFWTLGTISLTWTFGMMALRKADIGEFFAEFIRFIVFFGFFLWLLRNGPSFASSITRSLQQLGEQASGVSSVTPSGIVDIGFLIWKQAITSLSIWSPIDSFVGTVLSAGIMLLLAVVAVNMLLILVSAWILMYAGIFFLGFGGSRWTSDMAINYYKTVLGVAVQLFAMVLLVGIGNDLLTSFYTKMGKGTLNFEELGVMLVFCVALLLLVSKIPPLLASVITGGGVGAAGGIGNFSAGAVAGAAMGAAGMAATATSMAGTAMAAGASNMAGGAQALMAAFSKASSSQEAGSSSSGTGDLMAAAGGVGGGSGGDAGGGSSLAAAMGDSGGAPGEVKSGGSRAAATVSAAAAAATKAGRVAAGTVGNLAQGSWDVAKAKASSMKDAAMDRISETAGGKIAAAIQASSPQEPAFSGDSLSAGKGSTVASDEVADFVNKPGAGTGAREPDTTATLPESASSSAPSDKSVFD